jgi:outer membrane protein assembly factor BamB
MRARFFVGIASPGVGRRYGGALAFSNLALGKCLSFSKGVTAMKPVSLFSCTLALSILLAGAAAAGTVLTSLKWEYPNLRQQQESAAVGANGTVYIGGEYTGDGDQYVFAFDPDGTLKWQTLVSEDRGVPYEPGFVTALAVAPDSMIYVGTDYQVKALYSDGTVKWTYSTGAYETTSPAVAFDGTVYIGSDGDKLLALSSKGTLKWTFANGGSAPAIAADGTVYTAGGGKLYAVRPDGSQKWQHALDTFLGDPVIGWDGTVYITSYDNASDSGTLHAISPTGSTLWTTDLDGNPRNPVIGTLGSNLYVGTYIGLCTSDTCSGAFYSVNANDGSIAWQISLPEPVTSDAAAGYDGRIYVNLYDGYVYAILGQNGTILDKFNLLQATSSAPVIAFDGTLYLGANAKFLAIRSAATGPAFSPWPLSRQWLRQTATVEDGAKKWSVPLWDTYTVSSPALAADGSIYLVTGYTPDTITRFSPDGSGKWSTFLDTKQRLATRDAVLGPDGTAYFLVRTVATNTCYLEAFDTKGIPKWQFQLLNGYCDGAPLPAVASDGTIYVVDRDRLRAVRPDGSSPWAFVAGQLDVVAATPAIGLDGSIYITAYDRSNPVAQSLIALRSDGTLRWRYDLYGFPNAYPYAVVAGFGPSDNVYVTSSGDIGVEVYAVDAKTGIEQWYRRFHAERLRPEMQLVIGLDGTLYLPTENGTLFALDPADGSVRWQDSLKSGLTPYRAYSPPVVGADGTLYLHTYLYPGFPVPPAGGTLWAINPNGSRKWAFDTASALDLDEPVAASPVIAPDGTLYVLSTGTPNSELLAIKTLSGGLAPSAWPMFGHDPQHTGRLQTNTLSGELGSISVTDPVFVSHIATVLFDKILTEGWVDVTVPLELAPPPDYRNVEPPFYRDVSTTAQYTGPVEVCFDLGPTRYINANNLRVFHREEGAWVDRTSAAQPNAPERLCATVDTLSEFAIFESGLEVAVDIKPSSCPNPLDMASKGVLPAAILGSASFDVTQVDPESVLLFRADQDDPAKISPLRWALQDVATPYEPFVGKADAKQCTSVGADGFLDLTLKFDTQAVVEVLGEVSYREAVVLKLQADLLPEYGGSSIVGEDVVLILEPRTKNAK